MHAERPVKPETSPALLLFGALRILVVHISGKNHAVEEPDLNQLELAELRCKPHDRPGLKGARGVKGRIVAMGFVKHLVGVLGGIYLHGICFQTFRLQAPGLQFKRRKSGCHTVHKLHAASRRREHVGVAQHLVDPAGALTFENSAELLREPHVEKPLLLQGLQRLSLCRRDLIGLFELIKEGERRVVLHPLRHTQHVLAHEREGLIHPELP